ncbi:GAF domain-containing protein [Balneatrix alpica]|uniref:GAF domain-containing protein n=1 Tax=Balneatrix alpica TaxID=75684 RepID=A0ABV5ZBW6_9GAMM|nr:GAF domain-containing protein [Balneatrix alpica]
MYDFSSQATDKTTLYQELQGFAQGLLSDSQDMIVNLAQISSLLYHQLPDLNWAGFYLARGHDTLLLGPYQGKVACVSIPFSKGVCGAAARSGQSQCVADVHTFPGHIACDAASRSEVVIPLFSQNRLLGVLDLDSPLPNRFDAEDVAGLEALCALLVERTHWSWQF